MIKWTYEKCAELAALCQSKVEFKQRFDGAYQAALRNKWVDSICSHITKVRKPDGYWDVFENVKNEAACHCHITDFKKASNRGYNSARINGWLQLVCEHMTPLGNRNNRFVYEIADHDRKIIYIGLTVNPSKRLSQHRKRNKKIIESFGTDFKMTSISEIMTAEEAIKMECDKVEEFRLLGYTVLNEHKAGGLGSNKVFWTFEKCQVAASSCATRSEFLNNFPGAYNSAKQNQWFEKICSHMPRRARGKRSASLF